MPPELPGPETIFFGSVKSAGKDFGFLSCTETFQLFGTDVFVDRRRFQGDGVRYHHRMPYTTFILTPSWNGCFALFSNFCNFL